MKKNEPKESISSSIYFGFKLPLTSLRLIASQPKLIALSVIPVLLTLGIYLWLATQINHYVLLLIVKKLAALGLDPTGWFAHFIFFFLKIGLFILSAMTFSFASSIIACPFNDFLAEAAEAFTIPRLEPVTSPSFSVRTRLLFMDASKSFLAAFGSILALLFSWAPGINIIALLLAFLLFCFQYISYPQTRRGIGTIKSLGFIAKYPFSCLSFGAALAVLFSIPILSCFVLPIAVVGGTLLVARAEGDLNHPALR